MAAIPVTIVNKIPLGRDWLVMMRTGAITASQSDQYIPATATGFRKLFGAFGTPLGAAPDAITFVLNSRGNAVAEDTNPGDLAVRTGQTIAYEIWAIGRGRRGTT